MRRRRVASCRAGGQAAQNSSRPDYSPGSGTPAISPDGFQSDAHESQLLDNWNYLVIGTCGRCCYDLSSHNGSARATIRDSVIQEVTPGGSAVWTWRAADHMGLDEVRQPWWSSIFQGGAPYDVFHLNSAVTDAANDVLISPRFMNAIYETTDADGFDNCPLTANADQADGDGDGVGNVCDNCSAVVNADQRDTNGDGYGNLCDGNINTLDLNIYKSLHRKPPGPAGTVP